MTQLLTVPEAALQLCISSKTAWRMVYGRQIDVVRIGRSVRIRQDSVDKLIDDGTTPAQGDGDDDDE
jgi:excisionase family DNA binding protein